MAQARFRILYRMPDAPTWTSVECANEEQAQDLARRLSKSAAEMQITRTEVVPFDRSRKIRRQNRPPIQRTRYDMLMAQDP